MTGGAAGYLDEFRARGEAIADVCTRCGDCFRACPMVEPAGIGGADATETTAAIVDLVTGGAGNDDAVRWAKVCSGSGNCIPACTHGINPRFMVQLARGFARAQKDGAPLAARWREPFGTMSRGVRILSRLQMPPEALARLRGHGQPPRQTAPEIVFYTGCNILKTPHIALLCLDILDLLGRRLRGHGRARPMLRRLPVPRGRFRNHRAGRVCDDRRARQGRHLDRAVMVPELPVADRRGGAAELRIAIRRASRSI